MCKNRPDRDDGDEEEEAEAEEALHGSIERLLTRSDARVILAFLPIGNPFFIPTTYRATADWTGCRTGNEEKLSSSQAEPGQSGHQISCCLVTIHVLCDILSPVAPCTIAIGQPEVA